MPVVSINGTRRVFILLSAESNYLGTFAHGLQTAPTSRPRPLGQPHAGGAAAPLGRKAESPRPERQDEAVSVCLTPSKKRLDVLPETSRPFARNV